MSTAISLEFETHILNTLDLCLGKIADSLERKFDPTDKASMSLFHRFCMAVRIRLQWTKSILGRIIQPASKRNEMKKNESQSLKMSTTDLPVSWDRINDALKNYPNTDPRLLVDNPPNGLLMNR